MNWRDFKQDPPYDSKSDEEAGYETDAVFAYFTYRHTHRPATMNSGPFLSWGPRKFYGGVFEGYESHMKTSPYETDRIEILSWCCQEDIENLIKASSPSWS